MRLPLVLKKSVVVLAALAAVSFLLASNASAHAVVESTAPAGNSVLDAAPESVTLRFNEPVNTELGWVRLFDSDGKRIASVAVDHAENQSSVTADVPSVGEGGYVVVWRVVSADGHPVEGAFTFQVGRSSTPVGTDVIDTVITAQGGSAWLGRAVGVTKLIGYLSIALLAGAALFGGIGVKSMRVIAASAAISGFFNLVFLGAYSIGGSISDSFDTGLISDSLGTRTGMMIIARVALLATLGAVASLVPRRAILAAVGLAAMSIAAGGHAAAQSPAVVMVAIGAVHVFAVWIWIGAVAILAAQSRRNDVGAQIRTMSRVMNVVLPALVVTGALGAGKNMGGWGNLFNATYGRLVVAKVVAVALLTLAGLALRRGFASDSKSVRRVLGAELAVGIAVFGLTTVLTVTPPNDGSLNNNVFHATLVEAGILADVTVDPGSLGNNEIHLELSPPGGTLSPVKDVSVRYSLPSREIPFIDATVTVSSVNHWIGVMNIPYPGDWSVEVLVKSAANETIRYAMTVSVVG